MTGVRFRDDTGFEGKCDYCLSWWPMDAEFWRPHSGLRRCRACWALYHREHERGRRKDEIVLDMKRTRSRERYRLNRDKHLEANRKWKERNRERVAAYNREYRERRKAEIAEQHRTYYAEARDVILAKKRMRYAEQTGQAA